MSKYSNENRLKNLSIGVGDESKYFRFYPRNNHNDNKY